MKKTTILLATLLLSTAGSNLMAQTLSAAATPDANALHSAGTTPGYNSLPPGVDLLKNAIKNPDGSMTIKAGRQTPEANKLNRQYCEKLGGTDITNETDQTIGAGTLYAVVCKGPGSQQYLARQSTAPAMNPTSKSDRDESVHFTTDARNGLHLNPFGK